MIKKKILQPFDWFNTVECLKINEDNSVSVNLVLTEGTGEEEKEQKRENGFSFPVNSEAYNALALTAEEILELKNPPEVKEV